MKYLYGMPERPFAPMCQPMDGLTDWKESSDGRYYNVLKYNRKLTDIEIWGYELEFIAEEKD